MKRNVYIAKDFRGYPIGVILAPNRSYADTFWSGARLFPHSVEEFDLDTLMNIPEVLQLVKCREVKLTAIGRDEKTYVCVEQR